MTIGEVVWYNNEKGRGGIVSEDDDWYIFSFESLLKIPRLPKIGDKVEFEVVKTRYGEMAVIKHFMC